MLFISPGSLSTLSGGYSLFYNVVMTKVAAIQMVSSADVSENLETAEKLIGEASAQGAEFITLPENFPLMGLKEQDKLRIAENPGTGIIQGFLARQSSRHHIWLLGGTIPLEADDPHRVRAASLLYNPDGKCAARYDKIHLFDVLPSEHTEEYYKESATIEAGDDTGVVDTGIGKIGLSVCYDLRFPELYRNMLNHGVQIISVPSAFTAKTGEAHWETLLRARAVENLSYVVASNQGGMHANHRATWGHSMIIDPWGKMLGCVVSGAGMAIADIDLQRQMALRKNFPVLEHRKLNYQMIE